MSNPDGGVPEPPARAALGADLIIPLVGCALTLYYLLSTTDLVWEARATGTVIGLILLALCAAQFVKIGIVVAAGRANLGFGDLFRNDTFNRQRFGLLAMVAVYVATIYWVGASIGLFFLLIGCMWQLGVRNWRQLVGISLVAALFVHLTLIVLLDSRLPRGIIMDQFAPAPASEKADKKK
jgi:hypothetical protein